MIKIMGKYISIMLNISSIQTECGKLNTLSSNLKVVGLDKLSKEIETISSTIYAHMDSIHLKTSKEIVDSTTGEEIALMRVGD